MKCKHHSCFWILWHLVVVCICHNDHKLNIKIQHPQYLLLLLLLLLLHATSHITGVFHMCTNLLLLLMLILLLLLSLSILTAILQVDLGGTRMSSFWILLELRMMEVVLTTGAISRAKLQSKCHHQQTNTQFFTGRMPFLSPNQQCQSTEGKILLLLLQHET